MALTYTQLDAITTKTYIPKLIDNVFDTNQVLKRFNRPDFKKLKSGGTSIMAPIISNTSTSGGWYSDYDELDVSPTENITAAEFNWKQFYEAIRIARSELLKNNGDAQKLSLIESKMQVAEASIKEKMATGLFSDGTAFDGNIIDGFGALLSSSSTYGGVAVADLATWIAQIKSNSGTDRALSLPLMQNAFGAASFDTGKPTALFMRQNVYDQVWALYQPHQRLMSSEMSKLGFDNVLMFNGLPCIVDSHADAQSIHFIDEKHVYLCVHKEEDMRKDSLKSLETSNTMLTKIYWMGNLVCQSRRTNALLSDIAVSA